MARAFDGKRLGELRKAKGWTAFQLGSAAGIQPPQIYRYEGGKDVPQLVTLIALADALGVTIDDLCSEVPEAVTS